MNLLTPEIRETLPALYSQDGQGMDAIAYAKLFDPTGRYTLYITEFDGEDTLFGYCVSPLGPDCDELGYASLQEISEVKGRFGLGIERDLYFTPKPLREAVGS